MQYETEATIRQKVTDALQRKRDAQKKTFRPEELESPFYKQWIQNRVDDARRAKRLLTAQQYADYAARRDLRLDDPVRFVGESRLEPSRATGKQVLRPHGQTGRISQVQRGVGGRLIFTFTPDIPKQTRDAAVGLDIEVMQLVTAEWTDLERIV